MADTMYILRYLPLFYEELEEKVVYIAEKLKDICKGQFLSRGIALYAVKIHKKSIWA